MKVIVSQPRYLPAINYVQRLYHADLFVILDNVQRQSRGWENRNKILCNDVEKWLTIPVSSSSRALIKDTVVSDMAWIDQHKRALIDSYKNAPFYDLNLIELYYKDVESCFEKDGASFSDLVTVTINNCCSIFGFTPNLILASEVGLNNVSKGPGKIVDICHHLGADMYVSGENGIGYGICEAFESSGIDVMFHDFSYPKYIQFNAEAFHPYMSFFDMLFNIGLNDVFNFVKTNFSLRK